MSESPWRQVRPRIACGGRDARGQALSGSYNLIGRNCETIALWCMCNFAESLQRQRFQSVNASVAVITGLIYAYLDGRKRLPAWAPWTMAAVLAVRSYLLFTFYRHNKAFYRDVDAYYTQHGRS